MAGTTPNSGRVPKRHEISDAYKWRLEDIFKSDDEWEAEFEHVKELVNKAGDYEGKVGASAENLQRVLALYEEALRHIDRLVGYAAMRRDEDNQESKYQSMSQRAYTLASQVQSAFSYIEPEILATPEETIWGYLEENPELKVYKHALDNTLRRKNHVLGTREEQILAEVSDLVQEPETIFSMLKYADMRFGMIVDEDGNETEITHGRYVQFQRSHDRRVRRESFEKLYAKYIEHKNTLAATYNASVKADAFFARMRRHESALAAKLHPDKVPMSVYDNLIATVRANIPSLNRYMRLRRDIMGLDELHFYDTYVPLVQDVSFRVPWEESKKIVKAGLYPLGEEYAALLDRAFEDGWIDVYESEGKTSGGYVRDVYGTHPYVLLNYQDSIDDLFTLAHELGHAMHSYYTHKNQPFIYSNYSIFVAEVASTVNEVLLVNYLLDSESDPKRRMYVLNHALDGFRAVMYRQTMFAEFEKIVHERVEAGEPLTAESLSEEYRRLVEAYYGSEVRIDDQIDMEWARIPHFYTAFYVYKYSTGFAAANAIAQGILSGKAGAVRDYLEFLSAGSSDYPLNVLARAGVDMSTPEPINQAFALFDDLLEELEVLAAQFGMRK